MDSDNIFAYETLALDKGSVRSVDDNGFLHVKISPLTRVQVAPYYGKEIPGWQKLGLTANKVYYGYRPESELKKADTVNSINGIPIQLRHHPDFADNPAKDTRIGATGTDGAFKYPYLMNSLHFFDKKAKDLIESEGMRELSLAYRYKPDFSQSGVTENGQAYDFIMRDISGNHLALVEQGRAGHEVLVYDHKRSDMDKDEMTNLVNDALDKKLSGIVNALNKLTERVNKYAANFKDEEPEEEKVTETEEAEEIVTDKCGGKKTAKDKKPVKQVDEEGEEVEEVIDLSDKAEKLPDTKPENKKKAEKVETETEEVEDFDEESEAEEETAEELEKKGLRKVSEDEEEIEAEETKEVKVEKKPVLAKGEKANGEDGDFMKRVKVLMKKAGIDENAPEDVKAAFINGIKVSGAFNKNLMAQDEAAEVYSLEDINNAYEVARNDVMAEIEAIEAVRPVMGKIEIGAYDSAEDVYKAACDELDIACDSASARTAYEAYMKAQKKNLHNSGASQKATEVKSDLLSEILNRVNVD